MRRALHAIIKRPDFYIYTIRRVQIMHAAVNFTKLALKGQRSRSDESSCLWAG